MSAIYEKARFSKGSVLLEAIVALTAIMVTVVAIVTVISISVSNSTFVKNQNTANKLAQEGMEFMRKIEEEESTAFRNYDGLYTLCFDDSNNYQLQLGTGCTGTYNVNPVPEVFDRTFEFDICPGQVDDQDVQVIVTVAWSSGKCTGGTPKCHESKLVSCFSPPINSQL